MTSAKHQVKSHFSERATEWAACYADPEPGVSAQNLISRQQFGLEMVQAAIPPSSRILDIGCGSGVTAAKLQQCGYAVWGIDLAEPMIRHARHLCGSDQFAVADLEHMPFPDNTFGGVVALGVLEFLESEEQALREIRRVLRPGGTAVITIPNGGSPLQGMDRAVLTVVAVLRSAYYLLKYRWRGKAMPARESPAFGLAHARFYHGRWRRRLRDLSVEPEECICHGWGWFRSPFGLLVWLLSKGRTVCGRAFERLFGRALLSRASDTFVRSRALNWLAAEQIVRVRVIKQVIGGCVMHVSIFGLGYI